MSRIGKLPIKVPKNVNVTLDNKTFKAKGPHGELTQPIPQEINVAITDNLITLTKNEETIIRKSGLLINFFGGFIGSVIGTLTILFLYINEYLPLDLLKLK